MQLKMKAKLPTVMGLTTKHTVCRNTLMLKPIFVHWEIILMNCTEKLLSQQSFSIYTPSHHRFQVQEVLGAREI